MTASIPMKGDIDSLNASVAAGVLAYEIDPPEAGKIAVWKEEERMERIRKTEETFPGQRFLTAAVVGVCGLLEHFRQKRLQTAVIEDTQVPLYDKPAGSYVRTPIASGVTVYKMIRPLWMRPIHLRAI